MKQIICGNQKGYLISRNDAENKLKKGLNMDFLTIIDISLGFGEAAVIWYSDKKREKQRDYFIDKDESKRIVIKKKKFTKLLGIKSTINNVCFKLKQEEKYIDLWNHPHLEENCYCFFEEGEPFYSYVKEL